MAKRTDIEKELEIAIFLASISFIIISLCILSGIDRSRSHTTNESKNQTEACLEQQ